MNKKQLRRDKQQQLLSISEESYNKRSCRIHESLFSLKQWQDSSTIGITVSRFPEVDTRRIIERCWEEKKKVAVPRCIPKSRQMIFYELTSFGQLEETFFGLLEPTTTLTPVLSQDIDFLVVPGLLYERNGYRLGFGGGYYDRFLEKYEGKTVSLCFEEQLTDHLPIEHYDLPVKTLIGEGWVKEIV
ncbi:5-formyltetrahydrofolate cyclo-ligase [Jeotgalibacillus soli]|uniref:5-formyltetrahydrofolate cyclo-ligase n=1 Tax=Jeotgalibacillus soli TaxID=889306 RepID=A0A0C2V5Y5_9BACL|nr:5-formyltetrahydrofolate cyclo-ligase [Jeotgalibacillus soli]KIL44402.1 hypothetical protein KP78_33660 [Jeotgalibacillus soli]